jgi:hypothetical protein
LTDPIQHIGGDKLPSCPTELLSVRIPVPLNRRLNDLRDAMPTAGGGQCRKHVLVAAMLHAVIAEIVSTEGEEGLARRLTAYNNAEAREIMSDPPEKDEPINWPAAQRGRPREL